ncbi:MAG: aspartate aminotransferase family protein [Bacteroidales bacterium]|nr:aspartate aminotransferase family protein [Bacteroidales bacterium]MBN2819848.1 aspartate aminotransferase family protein [Bacteroidales bacterium]
MQNIIWSTGHKRRITDIVEANNCTITDSRGNTYTDLESGVWATSVGHSNPKVNKVIKSQVDKIAHTGFCYCNPIIEKCARNILDAANLEGGKCEFLCSGSEAVEYAMRVAQTISNKPKILTFTDSYFGAYGTATQKESDNLYLYNWLECTCNNKSGACSGDCKHFNEIPFDEVGIFLFEPGSSSGLVRFPPVELIDKIIKRIKSQGGLVVANEITTGIGRTGKWFGFQHYPIQADIVAMGKGLGNGYPVSAVAISKEVSRVLEKKQFHYSQSHQNDPLGASVANEVLNIIRDEKLLERCSRLGNKLLKQLNELQYRYPVIKEVRGRGFMIGIELHHQADQVFEELFNRGFLLVKRSYAEVLRMDPALTIDESDLDLFVTTFEKILQKINC